jgi:hypothetical protein
VLGRIFGPKRDEETGEWRRLHNEEVYNLCSSPNNIWVIISKRMRRLRHVARMGQRSGSYRLLVECAESKRPPEHLYVNGRIILDFIFKMWDAIAWTGLICFIMGTEGRCM